VHEVARLREYGQRSRSKLDMARLEGSRHPASRTLPTSPNQRE